MPVSIRIRRGTTTQWNASTNVLAAGEIALDTTLGKIKVGNGSSLWQALPYLSIAPSELLSLTQAYISDTILDGTGLDKSFNAQTGILTLSVDSTIANKEYVDTAVSGLGNTASTTYIPISLKGNVDGVAELDENGFIPDSQIPAGITRDTELSSAVSTAINDLVDGAPAAINTLNELAAAINDDASYASTVTTALGTKAPIESPTFTGTVVLPSGTVTSGMILDGTIVNGDISNTAAIAQSKISGLSTSLGLKADLDSPTFTGTVSGITKAMVGLGNVSNLSDADRPVSTAVASELAKKVDNIIAINPQSGSYTLAAADADRLVELSGGGTLTIPSDSEYNFAVGTTIEILQTGTSQVTIAGSGFTPNATPGLKLRTQWSSASLLKRGSNSWVVLGDLAV